MHGHSVYLRDVVSVCADFARNCRRDRGDGIRVVGVLNEAAMVLARQSTVKAPEARTFRGNQ